MNEGRDLDAAQEATRPVDGARVHRCGAGPAIVLIHGVGMDLSMWMPVMTQLCPRFDVLAYDMIGHGPGPHRPGPYKLEDYVGQLDGILRDQGVESCVLVGFSMGSLVAELFAILHPKKVDALVVLNGVFDRSPQQREEIMHRVVEAEGASSFVGLEAGVDRWFTPAFRARCPEMVESVRRLMLGNDLRAFAASYRVFATEDIKIAAMADRITCPTLIVTGEDDQRSTPEMAGRLGVRLPHAEVVILPDQRHLTPLEIPELIAQRIEEFATDALAERRMQVGQVE